MYQHNLFASDTCINVNIKATKPDEVLVSHLAVQILQHLLLLQSNNSVWCVYGWRGCTQVRLRTLLLVPGHGSNYWYLRVLLYWMVRLQVVHSVCISHLCRSRFSASTSTPPTVSVSGLIQYYTGIILWPSVAQVSLNYHLHWDMY